MEAGHTRSLRHAVVSSALGATLAATAASTAEAAAAAEAHLRLRHEAVQHVEPHHAHGEVPQGPDQDLVEPARRQGQARAPGDKGDPGRPAPRALRALRASRARPARAARRHAGRRPREAAAVDGDGSGLDADLLGGLPHASYQQRVSGTCAAGTWVSEVAADGTVTCNGVAAPLTLTQTGTTARAHRRHHHAGSGARGISVNNAGVGPGVFVSTPAATRSGASRVDQLRRGDRRQQPARRSWPVRTARSASRTSASATASAPSSAVTTARADTASAASSPIRTARSACSARRASAAAPAPRSVPRTSTPRTPATRSRP